MSYSFNVFTGNLDIVGSTNGTTATYATFSAFPASAADGALAVALDTDTLYVFNTSSTTWFPIGKPGDALSVGTFDTGSASADGIKINAAQAIIAQSASVTNPGMVNTTTQSFAGAKTFTGAIAASNFSGSSSGTNTGDITLSAFGSTPSTTGASLSGQALTLQPADGTHPGGVSITTQTFAGSKTFSSAPSFSAIINTGTLTLPTTSDTLVGRATTDTLTNKTLTSAALAGSTTITDAMVITHVANSGTQLAFNLAQSSGTVLTLTTNSTASATLNLPAISGTETLVARATTDTLTNKTIAAGSNTITGLVNANLSGSAAITNANLASMGSSSSTVGTVKGNITGSSTTPSDIVLTSANTASSTVYRDGSGNFSAGTITATLSGSSSGNLAKVTGDIDPTSFSLANNQSAATNVTGLAFANASVRSAVVHYSVFVGATNSFYECGMLYLINQNSMWDMAQTSNGDNTGVVFTITAAGQIQYTTPNYAGFTLAKMGFRALVTQV